MDRHNSKLGRSIRIRPGPVNLLEGKQLSLETLRKNVMRGQAIEPQNDCESLASSCFNNRMLLAIAALAALVALALDSPSLKAESSERPNIVLIMADDMGFSDLGCYGGEIDTPNLNRLANEGVRFRNFYNNAKCEHTRASLLTGHWWHHVGASASVEYSDQTFGERMRAAGYRTLMSGKWHAGQTPYKRGFDRYYGLTDGCCNFWNPGHAREGEPEPAKKKIRRWAIDDREFLPFTPDTKDFYTTDRFTDVAIEYLETYRDESQPFLLYLAYTAPHYPLHASREDVAKYRGKYAAMGWDRLREQRYIRQQSLGVLPPNCLLSERDPSVPAWDTIAEEDRDHWDLRMATYAAMIDRMDRNIGRLLSSLEKTGKLENTIIFFLSDNGACDDSADRSTVKDSMPWEVTSYLTQGKPWANASNTPYRLYKTTDHEGGIKTPMIAFGKGVDTSSKFRDQVGHLIDFTPTLLELANQEVDSGLPGHSLVRMLADSARETTTDRPWPVYWQFGKSRAVRDSRWKLVQHGKLDWKLYDLDIDPIEANDLAATNVEKTKELRQKWESWWSTKEK